VSWGLNAINDAIGQDPAHTLAAPNDKLHAVLRITALIREILLDLPDDIVRLILSMVMWCSRLPGELLLHCDTSPSDTTNISHSLEQHGLWVLMKY